MVDERSEKLSFRVKAAFACGSIAYNILGNGIGMLALPIYSIGLGVSASRGRDPRGRNRRDHFRGDHRHHGCCALLCKERVSTQSQDKMRFVSAFKSTFSNRPYLILTSVSFLTFFGIFLVQPLGLYLNIYYVFAGGRAERNRGDFLHGYGYRLDTTGLSNCGPAG